MYWDPNGTPTRERRARWWGDAGVATPLFGHSRDGDTQAFNVIHSHRHPRGSRRGPSEKMRTPCCEREGAQYVSVGLRLPCLEGLGECRA
eukprot:15254761-Alexandrium_andersonii.AAC.1